MKEFTKRFLAFSSHVICFGLALDLFYVFLCAALNDNRVVVYTNNYGEVVLEMVLIPLTLIFCVVGLYFAWRFLRKSMRMKE